MKKLVFIDSKGNQVLNTSFLELTEEDLTDDYTLLEAISNFAYNNTSLDSFNKKNVLASDDEIDVIEDGPNTFSVLKHIMTVIYSDYKIKILDESEPRLAFLKPVESSMIKSIGYNAETLELFVEFNKGSVYCYSEVLPQVHKNLMEADSIGKYLRENIFDSYQYRRVSRQ